jgi:hypothetical protein
VAAIIEAGVKVALYQNWKTIAALVVHTVTGTKTRASLVRAPLVAREAPPPTVRKELRPRRILAAARALIEAQVTLHVLMIVGVHLEEVICCALGVCTVCFGGPSAVEAAIDVAGNAFLVNIFKVPCATLSEALPTLSCILAGVAIASPCSKALALALAFAILVLQALNASTLIVTRKTFGGQLLPAKMALRAHRKTRSCVSLLEHEIFAGIEVPGIHAVAARGAYAALPALVMALVAH